MHIDTLLLSLRKFQGCQELGAGNGDEDHICVSYYKSQYHNSVGLAFPKVCFPDHRSHKMQCEKFKKQIHTQYLECFVSTSEMMVNGILLHFDFIWLYKVFFQFGESIWISFILFLENMKYKDVPYCLGFPPQTKKSSVKIKLVD